MNDSKKLEMTRQNIWRAIEDYGKHSCKKVVLDDVSSCFVDRLAEDSVRAKQGLREIFRKSPVWDEDLDALVINGTRTHDPNPEKIYSLVSEILNPVRNFENHNAVEYAKRFFSAKETDARYRDYINAIKTLAPKAYAPGKKKSRIFKALCQALGIADETAGSDFQRKYAMLADELSAEKINIKLFVSLNPAHFITMSNPKDDRRGDTLTSCHSFNSTDHQYNNGCSGYARDDVTMIAFTASDPTEPETLNNRKTTRQLFMYKPGNGLLLQSRMYNTSGGTTGAQSESKLYRDLIQREISECEGAANLWKTFTYCGNSREIIITGGCGFGGYRDWNYSKYVAMLSLRDDCAECYSMFDVGTFGLCICCGDEICEGLYCEECAGGVDGEECDECGERCCSEVLRTVYDRNGHEVRVCNGCFDEYYEYCENCGEYYHRDYTQRLGNDDYACRACLERHYAVCAHCDKYYHNDDMYNAVDSNGNSVEICDGCRRRYYVECDECGRWVADIDSADARRDGRAETVCPDCLEQHYIECVDCGEMVYAGDLTDGVCLDCTEDEEDAAL